MPTAEASKRSFPEVSPEGNGRGLSSEGRPYREYQGDIPADTKTYRRYKGDLPEEKPKDTKEDWMKRLMDSIEEYTGEKKTTPQSTPQPTVARRIQPVSADMEYKPMTSTEGYSTMMPPRETSTVGTSATPASNPTMQPAVAYALANHDMNREIVGELIGHPETWRKAMIYSELLAKPLAKRPRYSRFR